MAHGKRILFVLCGESRFFAFVGRAAERILGILASVFRLTAEIAAVARIALLRNDIPSRHYEERSDVVISWQAYGLPRKTGSGYLLAFPPNGGDCRSRAYRAPS